MTVYENLCSKNIDELAEWLDKYGMFDGSPWLKYWDENYCQKCESVDVYVPELDRELKCAWCEVHNDKCKFFQDMEETPDNKQIIKMWLESKCE